MVSGASLRPGRFDRPRAVLVAGLILAVLAIAAAVLLVWNDRREQLKGWHREVAHLATSLAAHADQTVRSVDLVLLGIQSLVNEQDVQDQDDLHRKLATPAINEAMQHKIGGVPQLAVAAIVDAQGRLVALTRSFPVPAIDVSDRDYYRAALSLPADGLYLSAPVPNRGDGRCTFYLARPITGPDGKPIGIVLAGIDTGFFKDFYRTIDPGGFSMIRLSRDDGVALSQYGPASPGTPEISRAGPAPSDVLLTSAQRSKSYPLLTTVVASEHAALAHWRRTARTVAMLTSLLVSIILCLTLALARLFARHDRVVAELRRSKREADESAFAKSTLLEELRASEAALLDKSRVLELTLEHIDQGLLMVDADRSVRVCNRRAMELLDLPASLLASHPSFDRIVEYQHSIAEFTSVVVPAPSRPGEALMVTEQQTYERMRPNGVILEIQTIPLRDGGMVRTFTDITARRRSEEQVRYFAHHDGLTRLANRTVFSSALAEAIDHASRTGQRLAIHCVDLDGFKPINDTHGHATGDRVLVEVAGRLKRAVREGDVVGRMGGDEFAILQPLGETAGAVQLAQRLLSTINEPYTFGDLRCSVGLSVGIALFPDHATSAEALTRAADFALYRAKANGKGAYCLFDEEMDRRQQHLFQLEQELKQALPEDQFFLEYQPIVDAGTREPVYFEALLRWRHPTRGVVAPGDFIPLAERSGSIVPIGLWVLETACREARRWPPQVGLAVNVSPVQFSLGDLPGQVAAVLNRTGLVAHRLTLEVTEGVLLEETSDVREAMASLRALGVRFSLDDFGTAQSRLSYLRRFPFDVVKIDRSFVEDAVEQDGARAIVSAVLAIGRAFRLRVVGEGVEREDQIELLREMGCELIQGYLTGRPKGQADVPALPILQASEAELRPV